MADKRIQINAISLLEVDGESSVPTALYFHKTAGPLIGRLALEEARDTGLVNENFKLGLGDFDPGTQQLTRKRYACSDGQRRSAIDLADTYLGALMKRTMEWIRARGLARCDRLLVSEPLAFYASDQADWLANYRKSLKRVLARHATEIEFLPEPFAVFQYYRYGVKHTYVAQDKKYFALVIDFGGGTFDCSVVETSKTGDISSTGKHSRPLGAFSRPVGGFFINRKIAEKLVLTHCAGGQLHESVQRALRLYDRWNIGEIEESALNQANRNFLHGFQRLLFDTEIWKLQLSSLISDWRLDARLSAAVSIQLPENLFDASSLHTRVRLEGAFLRDVFVEEIWRKQLRACVEGALKRAKEQLQERLVNVVLLSGGSANLRWLKEMLLNDFPELHRTHVANLTESYQEVVAKGLAVECARRMAATETEFTAVTYNPMCLVLDPDERGLEVKALRPVTEGLLDVGQYPGHLLPSATALQSRVDTSLEWKVKLDHAPKRSLGYYFLRGTLDANDTESLYNVVQRKVFTPSGTTFDSSIRVRLRVSDDGTCFPTFVYRTDRDGIPLCSVDGEPFCLDMASAAAEQPATAFVGLDFGTSSSCVSFIDQRQVELCEVRSESADWENLNDFVNLAPQPIAAPLKALIGANSAERIADCMIDCVEALLGFMAFCTWAQLSAKGAGSVPRIFATGRSWQRSLGPLKAMLLNVLKGGGNKTPFGIVFNPCIDQLGPRLEAAINELNEYKHGKRAADQIERMDVVRSLASACARAMDGWHFGYFEDVQKVPFKTMYRGYFRVASAAPPFHEVLDYEGGVAFAPEEAVLINAAEGRSITLSPIYYWAADRGGRFAHQSCYVVDKRDPDDSFTFKAVVGAASARVPGNGPDFHDSLVALFLGKFSVVESTGLRLTPRATD